MHYSAAKGGSPGFGQMFQWSICLLLLCGCVPPRVLEYTSFHNRDFSERRTPARIQAVPVAELLKDGYLLIGYMDLRRNVRTCYEDNQCENHSDTLPSNDELQREAAQRGGDVLTLLEDRTVIEKREKTYCTSSSTTVITIDKTPQIITTCNAYRSVAGKLEAKISRALVWRHDPEGARGKANAQAIDAALKTLDASYRADESRTAGGSFLSSLFSGAKNQETPRTEPDQLGEQILTGIRNDDARLLYALARDGKLQKWKDEKNRTALMLAIAAGRPEAARTLLAIDPGLERLDNAGLNAMHYAVARADVAFIKEMTKAGYDIRQKTSQGTSLLYFSLWNSKTEVFEWLHRQGLDPRARGVEKETLLMGAADAGNEALLQRLLGLGVEVDSQDKNGFTALMVAASRGQLPAVQILLKAHGRTDLRDQNKNTVLHHAAKGGKREILQVLLKSGLDVNGVNENGGSPLIVALVSGNWDAADYLMDRGATLTTSKISAEEITQLLISKNQPGLLRRYLAAYPPLKELVRRDPDWLQFAAKTSGRETIRYLVEIGARVDRAGTDGLTPLMTASSAGNNDAVRALIELKADATLRDGYSQTALKKATLQGHAKVVETLREFGVKE